MLRWRIRDTAHRVRWQWSAARGLKRRVYRLTVRKGSRAAAASRTRSRWGATRATAWWCRTRRCRDSTRGSSSTHGFLLTDLGSTNGTFVDGMRIMSAYVEPKRASSSASVEVCSRSSAKRPSRHLQADRFGALLGSSAAMRRLFDELEKLSPTDTTVLLQGETGTGKDLVARRSTPLARGATGRSWWSTAAGMPETLIESELFGHERGAFTGAVQTRAGAFEHAPTAAPCSSTRSASFRRRCRPSCCARSRRARSSALGSQRLAQGRRAGDRGDAPRSGAPVQPAAVPRGPLLPARGVDGPHPAAARSPRRPAGS